MLRPFLLLLAVGSSLAAAEPRAKNVVLFLGDAGGIPTLNAASAYLHNKPQALFIQHLPHMALVDTSPADEWVSDSAAGMTAIVTGHKTRNGVISQSADAVRGKQDGTPLKTLLEYAEERDLSTGVVTNMPIWDATPAACYAHCNERKSPGEIFTQILTPRFGDGVDIVIGKDRKGVDEATKKMGLAIDDELRKKGYTVLPSPADLTTEASRAVALFEGADFDAKAVVERVIRILSRNPKGYFLMVEWDMHPGSLVRGLERVRVMDELIRQTTQQVGSDTLVLFAADHSADLRLRSGKKGEELITAANASTAVQTDPKAKIRADNSHTGEEILAAGQGPGAEQLHGFIPNTRLFEIMMAAYGWPIDAK